MTNILKQHKIAKWIPYNLNSIELLNSGFGFIQYNKLTGEGRGYYLSCGKIDFEFIIERIDNKLYWTHRGMSEGCFWTDYEPCIDILNTVK